MFGYGLGRHVNLSLGERNVDDGAMTPWHITRHASVRPILSLFSEHAFTRAYEFYDELIVAMHATFHTSHLSAVGRIPLRLPPDVVGY